MRHARRTVGFFKVRGVNINHSDLEDAMFRDPEVVDFRAELLNEGNNDVLHLHVEMRAQARERVIDAIKKTFQVTPRVTLLERGTIAREFEANIKAPRFVDKRDRKSTRLNSSHITISYAVFCLKKKKKKKNKT